MQQTIEAVFENGVLRPLQTLSLRPNQVVFLHIEEAPGAADDLEDKSFENYCRAEGDPNITLEEVRQALAGITGSMTEACSAERDEE